MNRIVATGKTVEEAIQSALIKLNTSIDRVEVSVLEQPAKGLFGLIGAKDAKIEVVKHPDATENAEIFLKGLAEQVNIPVQYELDKNKNEVTIALTGEQVGFWIGRRGQMLDAVQYLVNIVANKDMKQPSRFILDAEQFREKRKHTLENLAVNLAERVIRTRKEVVLEPMTSLERKIIHSRLQDHPRVQTQSRGDEPNRRIVISLRDSKPQR